jgi:predicted nuclease with TOPRIM domain
MHEPEKLVWYRGEVVRLVAENARLEREFASERVNVNALRDEKGRLRGELDRWLGERSTLLAEVAKLRTEISRLHEEIARLHGGPDA